MTVPSPGQKVLLSSRHLIRLQGVTTLPKRGNGADQVRFYNAQDASQWYGEPLLSALTTGTPQTADARSAQDAASGAYDYVIITSSTTKAGSAKLNSFIDHKKSKGHSVLVVTEADFNGLQGQAPNRRAEKIRQWLINNYLNYGIEYVLLIGDPTPYESGEGDIPMKMCWPRSGGGR